MTHRGLVLRSCMTDKHAMCTAVFLCFRPPWDVCFVLPRPWLIGCSMETGGEVELEKLLGEGGDNLTVERVCQVLGFRGARVYWCWG